MDNIWLASALWIGLALIASAMQAWVAVSVALLEIIIGAVAGNLVDLTLTPWVNYLAGFGAILLTFLAGAEIDVKVIHRNFGSTMAIGVVGRGDRRPDPGAPVRPARGWLYGPLGAL